MIAAQTVDRVLRSRAFSNVVVHTTPLVGRDRALHQHLVYQTLRWLRPADLQLRSVLDQPPERLHPMVRSLLRVAIVDLHVLGTEPYAAVDQAVRAVKALGHGRASGLVNAVTRRAATADWSDDPASTFAPWIVERVPSYGADLDDLFGGLNAPAPVGVRIRHGDAPTGFRPVPGVPNAGYLAQGITDVAEEAVDYVDPATTAVVEALDLEPGMRVLDVAAAPGGKTRAIADSVGATGAVVACDLHRRRLGDARRRTSRVDVSAPVTWMRMDGRRPAFRSERFDAVLVDAPCSGLGTVRRRPEIRHRISNDAPSEYGRLQQEIVEATLPLLAPGGRFVYSVCTLFDEETTAVAEAFGGRSPTSIPGHDTGTGVVLRPDLTGTDGMFISVLDG